MNCAEFESRLADYLDGTLEGSERAAIEVHAAGCPDCRQFMADVTGGLHFLSQADKVEPPAALITRIAYLAPLGRTRDPFERQGLAARLFSKWIQPVLQPRLAMGMAMTILSFAMLKRCTGVVEPQQIQSSDLNPVRILGSVEDKALRLKDQAVKYYDNLRIVYEIETHLKDLEEPSASTGTSIAPAGHVTRRASPDPKTNSETSRKGNQP